VSASAGSAGRTGPARLARGVPPVIPLAIAAAWALAVAAQLAGKAGSLHHDALIEHGPPLPVAVLLFLAAWQVMLAAMMLPTMIPLLRVFRAASASAPRPGRAMAGFLAGYALVWSAFGYAAFCGDAVLHYAVDHTAWLGAHDWLIAGGVLATAGAFQFSSLKERCLTQCRHPAAYLISHYRRGAGGAFRLARGHALFCLGCCWALMLVMFAAGVASLVWMGGLTALMVYEKTARRGRRGVPLAGVALLAWAALVFLHPAGLPAVLGG